MTSGIGPLYEVPIYWNVELGQIGRPRKAEERSLIVPSCLGEAFLPAIEFSAIYSRLLGESIAPGSIAHAGLIKITGSFLGFQQEVV